MSRPKDEAIMVKCLAEGHKCRYQESNPHSGFLTTPELEFGALDRSATTLHGTSKEQVLDKGIRQKSKQIELVH